MSNNMTVLSDNEEHSQRRRLMGQLYNRSKMDNLQDMMLEVVTSFVGALTLQAGSHVELVTACRALEADVICKSIQSTTPLQHEYANFRLKPDLALAYRSEQSNPGQMVHLLM